MPARGTPLPQGRPDFVVLRELPAAQRRVRVRRLPGRPPRHRLVGRRPDRRVPRGRAVRPGRGDRLAGRPALVRRQRRHVGHVVLRLQLAADRRRAAAGAQGGLRDLLQRRPLDRRRALARRGAPAGRPRRLRPLHDADDGAPARAGGVGRRLARRVAAPARDRRALDAHLAAREPRRPLLAARLAALRRRGQRLRPDRGGGDAGRRLGRRLPQQLLPHRRGAGRGRGAVPAAGRAVGARRPHHRLPRAAARPRRRDGRVVRPLAARGGRHRRSAGRPGRGLRAYGDPAGRVPRPARGLLGLRHLAVGRGRRPRPGPSTVPARWS